MCVVGQACHRHRTLAILLASLLFCALGLAALAWLTRPDPTVLLTIVPEKIYRTPTGLDRPDPHAWREAGIEKAVLLISAEPDRRERRSLAAWQGQLDASALRVTFVEMPGHGQADQATMDGLLALLAQADAPVVIHCTAGMHRATVVEVFVRRQMFDEPPAKLRDLIHVRGLGGGQSRLGAFLRQWMAATVPVKDNR